MTREHVVGSADCGSSGTVGSVKELRVKGESACGGGNYELIEMNRQGAKNAKKWRGALALGFLGPLAVPTEILHLT